MIHPITVEELIKLPGRMPILDVRTPDEFASGHMTLADNLPLFTNEERARVGTTYKQQGREAAILLGFELTGPKWSTLIRQALSLAPQKKTRRPLLARRHAQRRHGLGPRPLRLRYLCTERRL